MNEYERNQRLQSGGDLLELLKHSGFSHLETARYLGKSNSTVCHWRQAHADPRRKVGVPSDEQLAQLAGLLQHHHEHLVRSTFRYCDEWDIRPEAELLLLAEVAVLEELLREGKQRLKRKAKREVRLKSFIGRIGGIETAESAMRRARIVDERETEPPTADNRAAHECANVDAKSEAAARAVTATDANKMRRAVDAWRDKCRQNYEKARRAGVSQAKAKDPQSESS